MDNGLKIFTNEEFGSVRTVTIDGEPWFVGKDVAGILGYKNTRDALMTHVDEDDKNTVVISDGNRGNPNQKVINESGLYSLILSSKLPSAKKFKHWVTAEVLPTLRKTGGYINSVDLMVDTYFSDITDDQKGIVKGLLTNIEEKQKKIVTLTAENDLLAQKNLTWADRPLINSLVRTYTASVNGNFGKAWREFKKELLYKHGINLNARITNYLNTSGKRTRPKTLDMLDDTELSNAISTIVAMCRENDIDISGLLRNRQD